MNFSKAQIIIIGSVVLAVLFFVLVFLGLIPGLKPPGGGWSIGGPSSGEETRLTFWGIGEVDNSNAVQRLLEANSKAGGAQVEYRHFDSAKVYEKSLLDAFATGKGPDIFMMNSSWLPKHYQKASPAPEPLNTAYVQRYFPDVVQKDFVFDGKVYALPLYIDTLALIYNKDIFNAKSIALVPQTWEDFQRLVPQLRELNILNQITRPAAAIGGSGKSINKASDFLNLLMLQAGSEMNDSQGAVDFGQNGLAALNFYIQFANPSSDYYTWNDNLGNSLDLFSDGDVAVIFNYQSAISAIKEKNPYLNFGVSPMPQFNVSQPVNYSNYWGLAVSAQSANKVAAWNFVAGAAVDPAVSTAYLEASGKPPALRSLIDKYKNDANLGVFARQALTAKSWLQPDNSSVEGIVSNMIESVISGKLSSEKAMTQAKNEINDLW